MDKGAYIASGTRGTRSDNVSQREPPSTQTAPYFIKGKVGALWPSSTGFALHSARCPSE